MSSSRERMANEEIAKHWLFMSETFRENGEDPGLLSNCGRLEHDSASAGILTIYAD